jgi:DNA uptake protein ComE-like DNA-binding protein
MTLVSRPALFKLAMVAAVCLVNTGVHAAEEKKPVPATQNPAAGMNAPATKTPAAADRMDINSASEAELATLDGIGEARAKAIVKGRPYGGRDDLVKKKVIPQGVYDKIKDQIIARQK